jgi:competence protein ComGF
MTEDKELFRSGTSKKSVNNSIIGIVFFSAISCFLYFKFDTEDSLVATFIVIFGLLTISAILPLFWIKEIILTSNKLIINWKFFTKTKKYNLAEIEKIEEEKFELNTSHYHYDVTFHKGRNALISFKNSKQTLRLDSYEHQDYYILINKLKGLTKKMDKGFQGSIDEYANFEQKLYGKSSKVWFIILLQVILIILVWLGKVITGG